MASELSIVPATYAHAVFMATRMREADRREVMASRSQLPLDALIDALKHSSVARSALFDGEVACMWGLVPLPDLSTPGERVASVWMLGTDLVRRHARTFWTQSKREVVRLFEDADVLLNFIDVRNAESLRWGARLGFQFNAPARYGDEGRMFQFFTLTQEDFRCALR